MHTWKIYYEDEITGRRAYLGELQADTMSIALQLASEYYEYDSGDLVAEQVLQVL